MNVYETVLKRRSIRRFKPAPVPYPVLEKMVDAGRLAPSGSNLQPCEFLIVDEPGLTAEVFAVLRWAGYLAPVGNPPEGRRPAAYIVVLTNREISRNASVDAAAAISNMILVGLEEGVGACWIGSVDRKKLVPILKIPERYFVDSVLALGYPDHTSRPEEFQGSVKYWMDENENWHVPKRGLKA